jgi:hypothetical protein
MALKKTEGPKKGEFICPECGKKFTKLLSAVKSNINKAVCSSGPYCSRSCASKGANPTSNRTAEQRRRVIASKAAAVMARRIRGAREAQSRSRPRAVKGEELTLR